MQLFHLSGDNVFEQVAKLETGESKNLLLAGVREVEQVYNFLAYFTEFCSMVIVFVILKQLVYMGGILQNFLLNFLPNLREIVVLMEYILELVILCVIIFILSLTYKILVRKPILLLMPIKQLT